MADSKTVDDKVELVVRGFTSSWNYTSSSWHDRWQNANKLYNNERVYVGYHGISDTFVPMSFSTVEAMVSATSGDKPVVEYVPTRPDQETNTKVLNGLFSFYWDIGDWTNKDVQSNRCYFKEGTTVNYFYWNIDHPEWKVIPIRDFFCDPTATILGYDNAAYMGYRFLTSKSALKDEMVVNPDYVDPETLGEGETPPEKNDQLIPKFKNVDELQTNYDSGEQTDKQKKDMMMGTTLDKNAQEDQVEVLYYETKDKCYYVGNRSVLLYEGDNHFKARQQFLGQENPTGMYSFTIDANYPDESQLYGKSILDPIAKSQELLNDLTNQNIDAVSFGIDPVFELDPMYQDQIDKVKNVTGAVYPFKPGSLKAVDKPIIPGNVFNERTNIKNEIRETTAVDEIAKGIGAQGDTTATEIKAQTMASGRRFELIVRQLEAGKYYRMAKLVFQMIQMYVTTPTMYRVVGKDGVSWEEFDPQMFQGDYEPRVKLKSTIQAEKNAKMRNYKEMYTALLGSPIIKQIPLTRHVLGKAFDLNPEEVSELVMTEEELAQMQPKEEPNKKEEPPQQIALKGIAKAYGNGTNADVDAQLEALAGLEPSVTHQDTLTDELTTHMANQQKNIAEGHNALMGPPEEMMPEEMGAMNG